MAEQAKPQRNVLQLQRLETLTDVVYAIVIWRVFMLLPRPGEEDWTWESIGAFLTANLSIFAFVLIGLGVAIIYWLQHNALCGNLERTDSLHTVLSLLQLFFLLLFLYVLGLGIVLGASAGSRALESGAAALVGFTSAIGWSYAMKHRRLLLPEVSDEEARELADRILAEPLTAVITMPFAFVGPVLWEIAWLSYPLVIRLLKRRRRAQRS